MVTCLIAIAAVAGVPPAAVTAPYTTVRVTAVQLFRIADSAVGRGEELVARRAYRALMNDPSEEVQLEARFRLAKLETKLGQLTRAATLLREVLDRRPEASAVRLELASLLDKLGDKDAAWRQVRAVQAAGLPPAAARIVDRYSDALRAQRPFGASLELALAPDSNINRATRSDTLGTILGDFQVADDAKPKSGTGLALSLQAHGRLSLGSDSAVLVRVASFANLYRKREFNDVAADLAVGPEFTLGRDRLQLELGATQRWFGQKPSMRSARVGGTLSHPLGSRTLLRLSGSAALVDNQLNDLQDGNAYSARAGVERALTATLGVAASVGFDRQSLRDAAYSTSGSRAGLTVWKDMGRMTLTAGAEFGRLHADERLMLFPHKRSDRYSRLTIGATFRQLQFGGFAPVARVTVERNKSSVEFYDYGRLRTEIGITRAF